jgi:excisionase family DNA binding protein
VTIEPLITARELGEHLSLSASTVQDMWERGELPGYRLGGSRSDKLGRPTGPLRFRLSEVEAVLATWREGAPAPCSRPIALR